MKKRVLSGMRPTGKLHLGHLVGALKNWVKFQDEYECLFMVADWHALMSEYERPKQIKEVILDNVIDWLSCGITPDKSTIFVQSKVPEHLELFMALSIITPLSWLERNPTYKEQLKELKGKEIKTHAFLGYPVLQAADILIYKANLVPVGQDQLPHLELAREIARRFKYIYKRKLFPEPKPILTKASKLLGLDSRKMSKSYNNFIALSDSPEEIKMKVLGMFTDPTRIRLSDPGHPKTCNVYSYFSLFKPEIKDELFDYCSHAKLGCRECKKKLAAVLIENLSPIRTKRKKFFSHKSKIYSILEEGSKEARKVASRTLEEVKETIGL